MIKCPICEKELSGTRAVHAHMLKAHIEEYRAKGCKVSAFGITPEDNKTDAPDDLRPLNKANRLERVAYDEGFRYFSGGDAYTSEECKKLGWI